MRNSLEINETATNSYAVPLEINRLRGQSNACMVEAVKWLGRSRYDLQRAKFSAAVTGYFVLEAKRSCKPGDWEDLCSANNVAVTTANRYAAFAEFVLAQGALEMPGLDNESKLLERGINAVMDSPKPWTALLRYTGMVAKQGQYDPDRYQQRKCGCPEAGQLEFDFGTVVSSVRTLSRLDEYAISQPHLVQLREELVAALEAVDRKIRDLNGTIEA